tara:strand:+ start:2603 stop:2806 length:204 start_codon:yes stop_codon:yes gene_type:complete
MGKSRCTFCKKKTGLIQFICDCGGIFCLEHRYTHTHNCNMISKKKEESKEKIKNENSVIKYSKIDKI